MRQQIKSATMAMGLLAVIAGVACAQGTVTQDPGRMSPGNLGLQQLGPSADLPGGNRGAGEGTTRFQGTSRPGSTAGDRPGSGAYPGNMGAGSNFGFGVSPTGGDFSRGIGPGR